MIIFIMPNFIKPVLLIIIFLAKESIYQKITPPLEDDHFQYEENQMNSIILDSENFKDTIIYGNFFVKFFAPWCGHCMQLAPIWLELSEHYKASGGDVQILKVDCTTDADVCNEYNIKGYPTLLFFTNGKMITDYRGERDLESLKLFVDEKITQFNKPINMQELNAENFNENINLSFLLFYVPTCPHCQDIFPVWRQLYKELASNGNDTTIAMINCHQQRQLCVEEKVVTFPTFLFFKNQMRIDVYRGSRELPSFLEFIDEMRMYNVEAKQVGEIQSFVMNLEKENFSIYKNFLFVKFFVPWCTFCKEMYSVWEKVASLMSTNEMVRFAQVDCSVHDSICKGNEIQGYPTMKFFLDGSLLDFYTGDHDTESIVNYVSTIMKLHTEL